MSAQKEEAKQRKRKSLKMALEKCMQRREAASTTNSTITTNTVNTTTNTNVSTLASTTTNATSTSPTSAAREAKLTHPSPQKQVKANVSHDMEAQETTETETSMDTSAEVNTSDICESREEDQESETSLTSNAFKANPQETYRPEHKKVKDVDVVHDDKPLDFSTTPTKKSEHNNVNDNEAKDVEAYLKSTAVIRETAKVLDPDNKDNKLEKIEMDVLNKDKEKKVKNDSGSDNNAVIQEKSASLKEN